MKVMKYIKGVLAMALLLMMSCDKEFIEVIPKSVMTTDLVFKTDNDFRNALNGVYRQNQDFYDYFWEFGSLRGDDVEHWALRSIDRVAMDQFTLDVNSGRLNEAWLDLYAVVRSANTVLAKLEQADASVIKGKVQYNAEAKFLRALAYFNLVRIFGDVPMVTAPLDVQAALKTPRTGADVIYNDVIVPDLLEAESQLPPTYSSNLVGLPTQGAAKSLLGKVYLTRQDFPLAETKLKEVTTMGYALLDDFEDLFDFDNEHHSEYIFDIEYIGGNVGLGSPFTVTFHHEDQDVGTPLVNALYDAYDYSGRHSGGGAGTPTEEFMNLFEADDLRKARTAVAGIYDDEGNFVESTAQTPRITLKYAQPGYDFDISNDSKANWRVIRYADVLLMLAEAMNENGKTEEALGYLNQVRVRAGLTGYSGLSQSEAREKIYLERRLELYLEGHRWFDLVRTGRAASVMQPYGMMPHMTVFPVPQPQIEVVNDPSILSQNDGY